MRRSSANPIDAARRFETKTKIELGGLVVKAGLREADRALILGGLLIVSMIVPILIRARKPRAVKAA